MAPPSAHAGAVTSRLDGVVALDLTVVATAWVLPGLREVRAHGELAGFEPLPGQDVMVLVPTDATRSRWRRYTVRRVDAAAGTLDLWVTTTTNGPGARWARGAEPGSGFEAVGPRGKVLADPTAASHVFVVDTSGLAAMCAMAGAIEASTDATVTAMVLLDEDSDNGAARLPGVEAPGRHTLVRSKADVDATTFVELLRETLDSAVDAGVVEPARTAAYAFAEFSLVRRAATMLTELGIEAPRIFAKPYWRAGEANQDNGEPDKTPR